MQTYILSPGSMPNNWAAWKALMRGKTYPVERTCQMMTTQYSLRTALITQLSSTVAGAGSMLDFKGKGFRLDFVYHYTESILVSPLSQSVLLLLICLTTHHTAPHDTAARPLRIALRPPARPPSRPGKRWETTTSRACRATPPCRRAC